jgi:hypothetical protein
MWAIAKLAQMVAPGMRRRNNEVMGVMRLSISLLALLAVASCKKPTPTRSSDTGSGSAAVAVVPPDAYDPQPIETTRDKMMADRIDRMADKQAKTDAAKGDKTDSDWVPAEFKAGMAKWKDVGVYVDGKPLGFLTWGELPIALKPTWIKDKVSAEKRPGTDDPGWRWAQQRFYKFTDYLKAVGIDAKTVNEVHVYGPKFSQTNIVKRKDLLSKAAEGFMFRFGGNTFGKPIPQIPEGFGNGKTPDKIAAVMIYIKKKPPKLVFNEGLELDGVMQEGVPYYGEPIRGGIRVYLDDKLAAIIKRQELDVKQATKDASGEMTWKLADVLKAQGVDSSKVVEVWTIRDELRADKFPGADLATLTFAASSQAKGGVLLTDKKIRASAIALHTREIQKDELPAITPDDE